MTPILPFLWLCRPVSARVWRFLWPLTWRWRKQHWRSPLRAELKLPSNQRTEAKEEEMFCSSALQLFRERTQVACRCTTVRHRRLGRSPRRLQDRVENTELLLRPGRARWKNTRPKYVSPCELMCVPDFSRTDNNDEEDQDEDDGRRSGGKKLSTLHNFGPFKNT